MKTYSIQQPRLYTKLLPCPFCGSEDLHLRFMDKSVRVFGNTRHEKTVGTLELTCSECGGQMAVDAFALTDVAVTQLTEKWNNRRFRA